MDTDISCEWYPECSDPAVAETVLVRLGDPVTDETFERATAERVCERHLNVCTSPSHIEGATRQGDYVQVIRTVERPS